jgi:hypothetical protein
MVAGERGEADGRAVPHDQAHGREQRDHHVSRPRVDAEAGAEAGEVGRMTIEPGEKVERDEPGGHQVGRVEAVAVPVDRRRIAGGRRWQASRGGCGHLDRRGA